MICGLRVAVSFKYDPMGRRIYKSSSGGTSIYAYDGHNLVEETNSLGAIVARYSQGVNIDEPLAMLRSSATSYYHADGVGSITSLSNTAGALAQTYTFDSFGKQTASSGSLTNPFQYTAREIDSETGLQFSRARYYDSNAGRFISEDPMRFKAGTNSYQYANNSPVLFNDPLGLKACIWVGNTDLFSYTTNENSSNGPWIFGGSGKMSGSRGPWSGGAPPAATPPPGVNPGGGVPWALPNCQWFRDHSYDEIETTWFVKNYICFETSPCGIERVWPEFEVAKRRQNLGRRHWPEISVQPFIRQFDAPIVTELDCLKLGPPNW